MPKYKKYPGIVKLRNKYYYRIQVNYKRKWSRGFDTQKEAYEDRIKKKYETYSKKIIPTDITLEQLIKHYLEYYCKTHNRSTTLAKDEGVFRNHIIPILGKDKIQDLSSLQLEECISYFIRYKTPSVAHNSARCLRKVLNYAVRMNIIAVSPLKSKLPGCPETEHPILEPEQLFSIVDGLEGQDRYIIASIGYTGFRRGEVAGLQKLDFFKEQLLTSEGYKIHYFVNLKRQVIDSEIVEKDNQTKLKTRKTKQARRIFIAHNNQSLLTCAKNYARGSRKIRIPAKESSKID